VTEKEIDLPALETEIDSVLPAYVADTLDGLGG
jgi:hypothetical protein